MRRELLAFVTPYRKDALRNHPWKDWETPEESSSGEHRMPGGKSRWSRGKNLEWEPLRPELVVEVAYEHMQSGRFRHMARFRRWRKDRKPKSCTFAQLEVVPPEELKSIFKHGR
jgi:ATP-dependent DNA ligase